MAQYQSIPVPVQAIQLTTIAITYEKWGGTQKSEKGDWLLSKEGEQYTCEASVFAETYSDLPNTSGTGWYMKDAVVEATQATVAGTVKTLEGRSTCEVGDYIITNPGGDQYCISQEKFDKLYQPVG